ncbi:hypothetical protein [Methylosinus sp. H3A]|uniref:hypothetical protein n=1 Tax=Methylosinus sp. H3A TaxID=2785786 RepID=UPI001AED6F14|nr:hypothetical protein [Methylosinus sp. H3A]
MIGKFAQARRAALVLAFLVAAPLAAAQQGRVWTFSVDETKPGRAYLNYGLPESDDSFGGFHCERRSGFATLFIAETSERLKAGARVTALLAVGATQAKVAGKLLPNEEAGVPSFEGRLSVSDPIFEAMAAGETLVATIAPSKQSAPLTGAAEKLRKFITACAKP